MLSLNYKKLEVWQVSKRLCLFIYDITKKYPKEEIYGLTSQIRRAVISIPSNIAEGYAKTSIKEQVKFVEIAYGSYYELTTQIELSFDLSYITKEDYDDFCAISERLSKLLYGYKKSLLSHITEN